jgi:hypothetical protein
MPTQATHKEIRLGVLEAKDACRHAFCYFRTIDSLPIGEEARNYRDFSGGAVDTEAARRLQALKIELAELLPLDHICKYRGRWQWPAP